MTKQEKLDQLKTRSMDNKLAGALICSGGTDTRELFRYENGELIEFTLTKYHGENIILLPEELECIRTMEYKTP